MERTVKYLSILAFVCVIFFFFAQKNDQTKTLKEQNNLKKDLNFLSSKKKEDKSKLFIIPSPFSSKEKREEADKKDSNIKFEDEKQKLFKNADEVLNGLFPNLEEKWGLEVKNYLKYKFPTSYIVSVLYDEQKERYREILLDYVQDRNSLESEYDVNGFPTEEFLAAQRMVGADLLPKLINLLTESQRRSMLQNLENRFFERLKKRKKEGKRLIGPSFNEAIKNMSPEEIERLKELEEKMRSKEKMENHYK